jgi:hypothetical protein
MVGWFKDLTLVERRTMLACFGGWSLDALDVQIFTFVIPGQDGGDPDGRCASADDRRPHRYSVAPHRTPAGSGAPASATQDQFARPTAAQN